MHQTHLCAANAVTVRVQSSVGITLRLELNKAEVPPLARCTVDWQVKVLKLKMIDSCFNQS